MHESRTPEEYLGRGTPPFTPSPSIPIAAYAAPIILSFSGRGVLHTTMS